MYGRDYVFVALLITAATGACATASAVETGTLLLFDEQQQGAKTVHRARMIVAPRYLRIDDGNDDGDFLLFDRANKTVYATNSFDRRILVIKARPVDMLPPQVFTHRTERDDAKYPNVDGRRVKHYRLFTNDQKCYDVFATQGLLSDARQALREYRLTLAGEQAANAKYTPNEMQSVCDLANNIFIPARHLEYGFPIRQQDMTGAIRQLVDYQTDYEVDANLFRLPKGYTRYTMDDMRVR